MNDTDATQNLLANAVIIRSGDRVTIALNRDDFSAEHAQAAGDALQAQHPGVHFGFIGGVRAVIVQHDG